MKKLEVTKFEGNVKHVDALLLITDLKMKRYKHIVQVTIGELKGAGVKSGVRCLWDSETDAYTSDFFMNVRLSVENRCFKLLIRFVVF